MSDCARCVIRSPVRIASAAVRNRLVGSWRWHSTLPPWAEGLSQVERTLAHWTERTLYVLLFAIPLSGLWLVLVSDDALAIHVAAHVAFFVTFAAHIGLVLKRQLINRDRFIRRMI